MGYEEVIKKYFPVLYTEVDFVKKTYYALKAFGFDDDNTIAATCICRDEISQSLRSVVKHMWGEAFNLSSLGGMFFAGRTGLLAAMHHAPVVDSKEHYVFYAVPHIAINSEGKVGVCRRTGRDSDSIACGALDALQKELAGGKVNLTMDNEDIEQSLIRMRLLREIPYGHIPDLLELTRLAHKVIEDDLSNILKKVVETGKNDYAVMTGIQIHSSKLTYIWPGSCYAVVNGIKKDVKLEGE
jgi:hypothetical protein